MTEPNPTCPHPGDHSRVEHPSTTCHRSHGCRCAGCREVHTAYMRKYRERRRQNGGRPIRESASGAKVVSGTELHPNAARDKPGPVKIPRLTDAEVQRLRQMNGVGPELIGPYAEPRTSGRRDRRYYPPEETK